MADDLNCDLGCYGNDFVHSPNIDRLAQRGVRFERAYCQYPVCNPSRASMLSGLYPMSTRVVDNLTPLRKNVPDVVCLPEHFRKHGYRTIKVGKITHTGDAFEDPRSWDVDERETKEAKSPPGQQILRRQGKKESGIVLRVADDEAWDGKLARQAVRRLSELSAADRPFFLAVGFRRPHTPYIAPESYFNLYPLTAIPPLQEPATHLKGIPGIALTYPPGQPELPADDRPAIAAAYWASLSYMDAQLGVLLNTVDTLGLWRNTIVVFVSDHGYHLGEHGGLWHKMTLFERVARVPMIVAAPGIAPAPTASLTGLIDIYPSLVELCGLPQPRHLEGTSFAAQLRDPSLPGKPIALTVVSRAGGKSGQQALDPDRLSASIRTERYRYTEWQDGSRELYDYTRDPDEHVNLATQTEHEGQLKDLSQQLRQALAR
jgi:uncharacterized sulfatase